MALARNAPIVLANQETVLCPEREGAAPVVGRLQFTSGNRSIVLLPSGRLVSVETSATTPTDRPFEPANPDTLAEQLVADTFHDFTIKQTRHYTFIYNSSEEFATGTSRILESMYPKLIAYCEKQGLQVQEPAVPLVVIMFQSEAEFQAYRPMPEGVVAYYNGINNQVVMYEKSRLVDVAPAIAIKLAISTVAHEGVHQILHNIGVQPRLSRWAPWISEGFPEFCSPTDVARGIRWKGVGLVNDLRLHNLVERSKVPGHDFGSGELIRATVTADSLDSDGYAAAWALTYFLAKHRPREFKEFLTELSSDSAPLSGESGEEQLARFTRYFGEDLESLEQEMIRRVSALPYVDPVENQPHYVVLVRIGPRIASVVTPSPAAIAQWQQELMSQLAPAEQASARVLIDIYPNRTLAQQAQRAALN
ncbi:MAG: DUF1570 domain-containing protein [Planctomycetales bacterium]|nr:DUF1570 domain-containing protein [Planctomycetales bacterium]